MQTQVPVWRGHTKAKGLEISNRDSGREKRILDQRKQSLCQTAGDSFSVIQRQILQQRFRQELRSHKEASRGRKLT